MIVTTIIATALAMLSFSLLPIETAINEWKYKNYMAAIASAILALAILIFVIGSCCLLFVV
jgi:hypothetical protein